MDAITYMPIGVVRSPFTTLEGMPLQSVAAQGIPGSIELEPAFREGLKDLETFSHLILLTHLHRVRYPIAKARGLWSHSEQAWT